MAAEASGHFTYAPAGSKDPEEDVDQAGVADEEGTLTPPSTPVINADQVSDSCTLPLLSTVILARYFGILEALYLNNLICLLTVIFIGSTQSKKGNLL